METNTDHLYRSKRMKPWMFIAVLLVNLLFFVSIGQVYLDYAHDYSQKLFDENINTVESLNAANANAAYTYTRSMGIKIDDTASYITTNNLSFEETLRFLGETNTNLDRQFQFVLSGSYGSTGELSFGDYSGVSVRNVEKDDGSYETVEREIIYGSGYYDILKTFTDVDDENNHGLCFAPEFTDPDTKLKCFAVYRHVVLTDEAGQRNLYTLLLAINSRTALNAYNMQNVYTGQSTVLINDAGDYIIKNNDYRNVNFFDYIVNYNGLTLDWRAQIQEDILTATENGENATNLFYKNHQGVDCVFSVTAMENGWYSVTCVPLSSFNLEDGNTDYSLIILLLFLGLFVFDAFTIFFFGKIMQHNVAVAEHATEAANNANQAKSRFLSTMSHELRTPLNAMIGLVALSEDSLDDPVLLRDYLKKIDISSKLLLQLISDILDVSAIESNKMKINNSEFDIGKLISALSVIYYDQCTAKGIEYNVVLKDIRSETLIGDSLRVNQVLLNFLSNAVKFTPRGGKVTLRVEQIKREDDSAVIRFDVTDTGCGISDELKSRLFRPFERADGDAARIYSGTGLGLSIAKNFAELMHGQIGMESQEGVGSCFWVEIPFAIPEKMIRRTFSPIKNLRVLAAVSNAEEREYLGQILAGFGIQRSLTDSVGASLELLKEESDGEKPFGLCMLDWKMSDLNALDATRKIRAELGDNASRIMILAYELAEAKPLCMEAGADMVLGKPVFPSSLYNALEQLTTGKPQTIPDTVQSFDLNGKRVLLVEDNKINIEIAQLLLEKVGLTVETAENGQEGYDRFIASAPGHFDVILMDVQMPVMNGYQAARAIRASAHPQAKSIPVLAMTADAFSDDVEKAAAAGMNEHLSKPIEPERLYLTIKKYLR